MHFSVHFLHYSEENDPNWFRAPFQYLFQKKIYWGKCKYKVQCMYLHWMFSLACMKILGTLPLSSNKPVPIMCQHIVSTYYFK